MSSIFGLDQLFGQGRTGIGQSIAIVEFEQYAQSDFATFAACYGLTNPIRNVAVDGGSGGPPSGQAGEAALDVELAAVNAPSASLVVYEAPNGNDAQAFDLFNRIASDDSSQVVTTSWGVCEQDLSAGDRQTENGIFQRMALQGQTVIAASGDSGSEDCLPTDGSTGLAVDDPGSQPNVVSAGGTSMSSASAATQSVWNCQTLCRAPGAGGGGYSIAWPANPGQPTASGSGTAPCGQASCRAVPDFSYPSDPTAGAVVDYWDGSWGGAGGTSVAAPVNAGLFADTNQGCYSQLGRVGPSLYAAQQASGSNFTDITSGNNDFTGTNFGRFAAAPGFDAASGLGTPVDQNLAIALQGAGGCPSVASVSPNTGPLSNAGAITIFGGGFANASSVAFGSAGNGRIVSQFRLVHRGRPAERGERRVRRRHGEQFAGDLGPIRRRPLRLRRGPQLRRGLSVRGLRRRRLQLSATQVFTAARAARPSTHRWWAWPTHPAPTGTGWWPPMAASSTTAMQGSSAPWAGVT